ncbi:MAG: response regulator [Anaerolineae bacterium]|nr:response regulator [Anaerolineae bacterium]
MAGERILLVEDTDELRQYLATRVLQPAGYEVFTAQDGAEGFTLARQIEPHVIVSGYEMPRVNGLSMLEALQSAGLYIPFILMTAEGSEALAVRALRMGVYDYLVKPFSGEELLLALQRTQRRFRTRQIAGDIPEQLLQVNRHLEQRLRELDTLVSLGKRVTAQLERQQVLHQVVEAAVEITGAESGSLLLVDQTAEELYQVASLGEAHEVTGNLRLPIADSLAGRVVQTRQPLVIAGEELQKIKTSYLFRALAYVPLLLKNRVIGVLGVTTRQEIQPFEQHKVQLLNVLADFAAIAIENAQLYAATEKERDTLNTILRDTEDPIIVVDDQGHVLFCNPAASRAFNVSLAHCYGQPLAEVLDHREVVELFNKEAHSGRGRRTEIALADGRFLHAQLTIIRGVGRVVVMQDITHLKDLDRIKNDFVTTVSHDLRTPLTAILGYVELVRRAGSLTRQQRQFLERIVFSVQSITTLISELLELGKIEAGFDEDREPVSLAATVRYVIETCRQAWEAKQHTLQVRLPDDLPPVLGNPLRLRQVVGNLLDNAIKYTPEGGQIRVGLETDGDFQILRVADTGIGVAQKDLPYIFDKFYRADEAIESFSGTGLGLSIVKGIVERHNGRIWVDSQVGKGTTFTVMLPSHVPPPDAPAE